MIPSHSTPASSPLRPSAVLLLAAALMAPAFAQALRVEVFNTRRPSSGLIWGADGWFAWIVDEEDRSLNGDMDTDDSVLYLFDARSLQGFNTGLAIGGGLVDEEDDDWPVALGPDVAAIQVSEEDQGSQDLNGDGQVAGSALVLLDLKTRKITSLGIHGSMPQYDGKTLFFVQSERVAKRDLNGDGDLLDGVLCKIEPGASSPLSLGREASAGFEAVGGNIAVCTSEQSQGAKDLNGDGDTGDVVAQLYVAKSSDWRNTGLECSFGTALTTEMLGVGVEEALHGNKDLNGDGDREDTICLVVRLSDGEVTNTGQDCSGELLGEAGLLAMLTSEENQARKDLNGDGDAEDEVVQVFHLDTGKVQNLGRDGSGGLVVNGGRISFSCSEEDQGGRDLNGDRDAEDYVVMVFDPARNTVRNTQIAADSDVYGAGNLIAWTTLEQDQFNRDHNRDGDTDDSVLFVMDVTTLAVGSTGYAAGDEIVVGGGAVAFDVPESDQGERDLDGDQAADGNVVHVARARR